MLKEKNIGFFGKAFFLKERFVLKEKICMYLLRQKPKIILLMNTFVKNMLFFRDKTKRSMSDGEEGGNKGGEAVANREAAYSPFS